MSRSATAKAPALPRRVCILVVGSHRSGTSALARVISLLGCDLPKDLMPPSPANESGYWESNVVWHLNDKILASAGTDWCDWLEFNAGWYDSPKAQEFREDAMAAV